MAIASNDTVIRQDIVDRFNSRVRDYVGALTNYVSSTSVWNRNVGYVTLNSTSYGGGVNRSTYSSGTPVSATEGNFSEIIGAQDTAGYIVKVIKNLMSEYTKNHKIYLYNTGNYSPKSYTGTARLNGAPSGTINAVNSDVENAANSNNITQGQEITASKLNNFIESCRSIWYNRCYVSAIETFRYSYCHSSCHTNHTCYNSRGRR